MERGQRLRNLPFDELKQLAREPIEHLVVESRPATIAIIVLPLQASGGIQVVVQGFLKAGIGQACRAGWFLQIPGRNYRPDVRR